MHKIEILFYLKNNMERNNYTLRFGLTFNCGQRCSFCNPKGTRDISGMLEEKEIEDILYAAYENGIKKVHFVGGEPLMCNGLEGIISNAIKKHEDFEFVFTTNGTKLHNYFDCFKGKVSQINFSLHSITPYKQAELAKIKTSVVKQQIENLKKASSFFPLVKLNCVALRPINLEEIPKFFEFCQQYNIVMRMMELHPYSISGQENNFFANNYVSRNELQEEFEKLGRLNPASCKGDNFCVDYFLVEGHKMPIGIMYFTDLGFKCPRNKCKSVFVDARGKITACSSVGFGYENNLFGKSFERKVSILKDAAEIKNKLESGKLPYPEYHIPSYTEGRGGLSSMAGTNLLNTSQP